MKDPIPISAQF